MKILNNIVKNVRNNIQINKIIIFNNNIFYRILIKNFKIYKYQQHEQFIFKTKYYLKINLIK